MLINKESIKGTTQTILLPYKETTKSKNCFKTPTLIFVRFSFIHSCILFSKSFWPCFYTKRAKYEVIDMQDASRGEKKNGHWPTTTAEKKSQLITSDFRGENNDKDKFRENITIKMSLMSSSGSFNETICEFLAILQAFGWVKKKSWYKIYLKKI